MDKITLYHHRKFVKTIKEFMDKQYIYNITPEDFFDNNRDKIYQQMTSGDKEVFKEQFGVYPKSPDDLKVDMTLPCPCELTIDKKYLTVELVINNTNFQSQTDDFYAFEAEKIQELYQNDGFFADNLQKRNPTVQVFGWFKSLYFVGQDYDGNTVTLGSGRDDIENRTDLAEFADLSRHIISLSTYVDENGGSFNIRLPIIKAASGPTSGIGSYESVKNDEPKAFKKAGEMPHAVKDQYDYGEIRNEYFAKSEINQSESNYFSWLISSNDLLFISFEKLEMELNRGEWSQGDGDKFDIGSNLAGNVYDMIGLVDKVSVDIDYQSGTGFVTVTGRDIMKLLIEDGSFFFNPSILTGINTIFANDKSFSLQRGQGDVRDTGFPRSDSSIDRLRLGTNQLEMFIGRLNQNIDYIIKGVISQLANIEIAPGYIFNSWGDDRTTFNEFVTKTEEQQ